MRLESALLLLSSSLIYLVYFVLGLVFLPREVIRRWRRCQTSLAVGTCSDSRSPITRGGEKSRRRKAVVATLVHGPTSSRFAEKSIYIPGYSPEGGRGIVALGMTLGGRLVVSIKPDGGSLQNLGPTIGFYAPGDCFQALMASVQATTGIIPGLRSRIKAVSPLGFEIDWIPASRAKSLNNYRNVVVAVGWPDTTGGNVLVRPGMPSIEKLKLFQRTLVLTVSQVIILMLSRIDRNQLNSVYHIITQACGMSRQIILLHVNLTEEEFQAQKCVIEECFTLDLCKTNHKQFSALVALNDDDVRMTIDVGQRSGVLHCYSGQSSALNLSEVFCHYNLTCSLSCVSQEQFAVLDILREMAKKVGIPDSYITEAKLEGGCDYTVTVER